MAYNPINPNSAILPPNGGTTTPFSSYSLQSSSSAAFTNHWTLEEHKTLELAILSLPENCPNRWQVIADQIPGKSTAEIYNYYTEMLRYLAIQRRMLSSESEVALPHQLPEAITELNGDPAGKKNKKRKPWTQTEHEQFLVGLNMYGKGDWKRISQYMVSKSSTQVASHAQKYYLRLAKKQPSNRSSIHDITTVNNDSDDAAEGQVVVKQQPPPESPSSPSSLPPLPPCLPFEG